MQPYSKARVVRPARASHQKGEKAPPGGETPVARTGEPETCGAGRGAWACRIPLAEGRSVAVLAVAAAEAAVAVAVTHEAVEFFAILGHAEVPHVLVEGADFLVEALALPLEPLQLLGTVVIEGGVAARVPRPAVMLVVVEVLVAAPGFGLAS